tara:strand:- start:191 stop:643 length:453 start_codon:yes stop_codon:yes gene_type:complete
MSRLQHVVQVGAALREAAPAPTAGVFWTSDNEALAHQYVKQWWYFTRSFRDKQFDMANMHLKYMSAMYDELKEAMVAKTTVDIKNPFPAEEDVQSVTSKLVDELYKIPWKEVDPPELKTIAKRLWSQLKQHIRGQPSMFDNRRKSSVRIE